VPNDDADDDDNDDNDDNDDEAGGGGPRGPLFDPNVVVDLLVVVEASSVTSIFTLTKGNSELPLLILAFRR
jgi:hypothetical protein